MRKGFIVLFLSLGIASCSSGGGETPNANATNKPAPPNANSTNTDNPLAVTTPTPKSTANNAPTLTPVYKAYCLASEKKDEAGLRNVYAQETLREFAAKMKKDGVKTLVEFLSDDQATTAVCEVRNEQINGETATAEVKTKGYPNGVEVVFIKENGQWKLTSRRPEGALK